MSLAAPRSTTVSPPPVPRSQALRLVPALPPAVEKPPVAAPPDLPDVAGPSDADLFAGLAADGAHAAACREQLVQRYGRLATSCARRYVARGENEEDLRQVAYVGLLEAMRRFDATRGVSFEFFARPTILGHLRRHFRDSRRWVRIPRRLQELAAEAKEAREVLSAQHYRAPTLTELAEHLGADECEVAEALAADQFFAPASLDAPVSSDDAEGACRGDLLGAPDPRLDLVVGWTALSPLIDRLPPREREILISVFWHDETQAVVGARVGISQMQVSRLLTRTLRELREQLEAG
ncbi:MAG TPA: SigB/SigF/SigG family RNA polymerase sigma factor [Sporichthya sp.]|nr:SigB/SigF/SigG family RNA polymerase sigma factor [Sporichthya sp.]